MSEDVKRYGAPAARKDEPTPDELRALIAQTGLSQRRAAEAIEISERMMRYYASGQEKIPRAVLYAMRYLASQAATLPSDRPLRKLLADLRTKVEEARAAGKPTAEFDATRGELNMLLKDGPYEGVMMPAGESCVYLGDHDVRVNVVGPPAANA